MSGLKEFVDLVESVIRHAAKHYWPPERSPVLSVEIELLERQPDILTPDNSPGYRVRKVEKYANNKFKKYGLSWKTGEWILVQQGEGYAKETFLERKPTQQSCLDPACPPACPATH